MKRILLSLTTVSMFAFIGTSQITMNIVGQSTDLSGTTLTINADPSNSDLMTTGDFPIDIEVHNNTGSSKSWRVTRKRIDVPSTWTDMVCLATCFPNSSLATYCTPASQPLVVANGATGSMLLHITPDQSAAGTAHYRYYLGDCTNFDDSMDVQVNFVLGLKTVKPAVSFSVAPNPANDFVTISTNGVESANVKVVDVLGNMIYTETMISSKKIDVSDFKNGIYFIIIETEGAKISNRKLVVRH